MGEKEAFTARTVLQEYNFETTEKTALKISIYFFSLVNLIYFAFIDKLSYRKVLTNDSHQNFIRVTHFTENNLLDIISCHCGNLAMYVTAYGFHRLSTLLKPECHIFKMTALCLPCHKFQVQYLVHLVTSYYCSYDMIENSEWHMVEQ